MAYVGGKATCYNHIVKILNQSKYDGLNYLEPFVGMSHILKRIENKKSYSASDLNPLVYKLLKGVQLKKKLPVINKKRYLELKTQNRNTFEKAIAAFTYSYNGKEFGGYTLTDKSGHRNYPQERIRYYQYLQSNKTFLNTVIKNRPYGDWNPKGFIIYCDPPYKNTTRYGKIDFDHSLFWDTMRLWSKHNTVFISEYSAPKDFKVVSKAKKHTSLSGSGAGDIRIEKLFQLRK